MTTITDQDRERWKQRRQELENKSNLEMPEQANPVLLHQPSSSHQAPTPLRPASSKGSKESFIPPGSLEGTKNDVKLPKPPKVTGNEKELHDFFAFRFGPFIVLVLYLLTANADKAMFYAPTPEECAGIAPHLAKLLAKLKMPEWVYGGLTSSDSIVTLGMVVVGYFDRIGLLEKFAPYFQGMAKKYRRVPANEQSNGHSQQVQNAVNGTNPGVPVDITGVYGIGSQYTPG